MNTNLSFIRKEINKLNAKRAFNEEVVLENVLVYARMELRNRGFEIISKQDYKTMHDKAEKLDVMENA